MVPAVRGTGAVPEAPLSAMGETRAQGPGEDEDRSKVTSGTAPVPLTPQRISPPAAYFPRFAQMRAAGLRYGQPNNVNPLPLLFLDTPFFSLPCPHPANPSILTIPQ